MSPAATTKSPEELARLTKEAIAAISKGDYSKVGQYLADKLGHSLNRGGKSVDMEGREDAVQYGKDAGPIKIDLHDVFGAGDRVVVRFSAAVASGALEGCDGAPKVSAIVIARFEGDKIAEIWHEQDTLGLLLANGYSVNPPAN
jgi:hypothetical protein